MKRISWRRLNSWEEALKKDDAAALKRMLRALRLTGARPLTPEEILSTSRRNPALSWSPISAGLILRLLDVSPAALLDEIGATPPRTLAARAIVRSMGHPRGAIRRIARVAAHQNISLDPAESTLRELLAHPDARVRRGAATHLPWRPSPEVTAMLKRCDRQLADPLKEIRDLGFADMENLALGIVERLENRAEASDPGTARKSLGKLWTLADRLRQCFPSIQLASKHQNGDVRYWSILALDPFTGIDGSFVHVLLCSAFDREEKVREKAAYALLKLDRPLDFWADWLLEQSRSKRSRDRIQAIQLLQLVRNRRDAVNARLVQCLQDPDAGVRAAAETALLRHELTSETKAQLRLKLADPSLEVAVGAAVGLAREGTDPPIRRVLLRGLRSSDTEIRRHILFRLAEIPNGAAFVDDLRRLIRDKDINIVHPAMTALESLGSGAAKAIPDLCELIVANARFSAPMAVSALGVIGSRRPPVLAVLRRTLAGNDERLRLFAAQALIRLKVSRAKATAVALAGLDSKPWYNRTLAWSILGDIQGMPSGFLAKLMKRPVDLDARVRATAREALEKAVGRL